MLQGGFYCWGWIIQRVYTHGSKLENQVKLPLGDIDAIKRLGVWKVLKGVTHVLDEAICWHLFQIPFFFLLFLHAAILFSSPHLLFQILYPMVNKNNIVIYASWLQLLILMIRIYEKRQKPDKNDKHCTKYENEKRIDRLQLSDDCHFLKSKITIKICCCWKLHFQ